ncbi:Glycosyl transferase family 8 [Paracoccus aminovorans]|uniref:Glycosyl transferase family 8 n=1 Tax=Paracoccus aminovorans TaxID=34004 RepID=A0A1I3B5E2_9RHOB|nr:glycosyltransferase [Paracoccus aminovorans]CQR87535.1 glycosyltransferase [Paracoccus aminovorans]SFH57420.1 Glycosyl transferase family 8 [Paracoccus aminovorans]
MRDAAFFLIVDDHYLGLGRAVARRLVRLWQIDCHVFLENGGPRQQDDLGEDGVFLQRNLLKGLRPEGLPSTRNWPPIVYDRIFAPAFLTGYRRLIYLDADIYPCFAMPELLKIPLPGGIGAVQDTAAITAPPHLARMDAETWRRSIGLESGRYFNSGMLLIDPEIWQRTDYAAELRSYMAIYGAGVRMPDQDFLNAHFQGRWTELSPRCNFQKALFNYGYEKVFPPVFLHFSSFQKPWLKPDHIDSPHGQFFSVYQEMFAQAGVDHCLYLQKNPESALRKWRTSTRHTLSRWGVVTGKEKRQRREWDEKAALMFQSFAEDGVAHHYADMDFQLVEMPRPRISFDGRYLRRALEVSYDRI